MRKIKCVAVLILCWVVFNGCAQNRESFVFGASYMTINNPFFLELNASLAHHIDLQGGQLIALDAALSSERQIEQIEDLITQGVDLIFINPVDAKAIRPALEKAQAAKIPVVNVDAPVFDQELVNSIVVSDNYYAGVLCAEDMMRNMDGGQVVVLNHPGAESAVDRIHGFIDTIAGQHQFQIIERQAVEGQLEIAMPVMMAILETGVKIDVVMALNDPAAMGALAALMVYERESEVLIYGIDGAPEVKRMIQNGRIQGTAAQSPNLMGKLAAEVAFKILENQTYEKYIMVPVQLITAENIHEFNVEGWE